MRILSQLEVNKFHNQGNFENLQHVTEKYTGQNSLFIFDLDFTLVMPKNDLLKAYSLSRNKEIFFRKINRLNGLERCQFLNFITYYEEVELVHDGLPILIDSLNKNDFVLGLSSMAFGNVFGMASVHEKRVNEMASLGIIFDKRSCSSRFKVGQNSVQVFRSNIFTNTVGREGKAEALLHFLEKNKFIEILENIVYIDDNPDNLIEMEKYISKSEIFGSINFVGHLFLEAYRCPPNFPVTLGVDVSKCLDDLYEIFLFSKNLSMQ